MKGYPVSLASPTTPEEWEACIKQRSTLEELKLLANTLNKNTQLSAEAKINITADLLNRFIAIQNTQKEIFEATLEEILDNHR